MKVSHERATGSSAMANDDLDDLRHDPAFKMALGKTPGAKIGLVSQPTMSRWENNVDLRCAIRMANAMIDVFCESYEAPPASITLVSTAE